MDSRFLLPSFRETVSPGKRHTDLRSTPSCTPLSSVGARHSSAMASTMTASVLSSLRAPVSLRQNTAGAAAVRRTPAVNVRARPPACSAALHHAPVGGLSQRRSAFSFAGVASVAARDRSLGRSGRGRIDARAASGGDESTASISKKVARAGGACKTLGRWGFWSQLVLATVSSVILVFSFLFKGITKVSTEPAADVTCARGTRLASPATNDKDTPFARVGERQSDPTNAPTEEKDRPPKKGC